MEQIEKMRRVKIREECEDLLGPYWVATRVSEEGGGETIGTDDSNIQGGVKAIVWLTTER